MLISTCIGNTSHKVQNPFMIKYQTGSIKDFDKGHPRAPRVDIVLLCPFPLRLEGVEDVLFHLCSILCWKS